MKSLDHATEHIPMGEAAEISWINFLSEFNEKAWPIFERYGFDKQTALLMWQLSKIENRLNDLYEISGDKEDWTQ